MPVLIPVVAGLAAWAGAGMVVGALAVTGWAAVAVGVVAGAVIGAAVGAVGALVTGGDIGEGALWGAVGGAVAGGFAGYAAGAATASNTVNSGNVAAQSAQTDAMFATQAAPTAAAEMTAGEGVMYAGLATTAGDALTGYAGGEAQGQINEDTLAANKEAADAKFKADMEQLTAGHANRMAEIASTSKTSIEAAGLNNEASMQQLNTRIGADREAVAASLADRDSQRTAFNDSIRGTDATLFERPTFQFEPEPEANVFNSGFDEAMAGKVLSPQERRLLSQQQARA